MKKREQKTNHKQQTPSKKARQLSLTEIPPKGRRRHQKCNPIESHISKRQANNPKTSTTQDGDKEQKRVLS